MKQFWVIINIIRFFPHLLFANEIAWKDVVAYTDEYKIQGNRIYRLLYLLCFNRSFRSLYYHRVGAMSKLISWLGQGEVALHIPKTVKIGEGTLLFHSYSTILNATSIGKNCRIVCNITLGDKRGKTPCIGDNVEILPGAVITGDVEIGDNCVIGPNAVVYKSVPANCVVVGNPAYILKEKGVVVNRPL